MLSSAARAEVEAAHNMQPRLRDVRDRPTRLDRQSDAAIDELLRNFLVQRS
jgi:hypothetical protein